MMRWLPAALLVVAAIASGVWLWQLREPEAPAQLVGPPRSDYTLTDFELVALDEDGRESFVARGPRLDRHPYLGTLDIEQPRFVVPDANGVPWTSRARRAFVSRDGDELQLIGEVELLGPALGAADARADAAAATAARGAAGAGALRLVTERLHVYPRDNRASTHAAVTITEPGSILRARGLRADLDARRVELLSEVRIRHEPPARR